MFKVQLLSGTAIVPTQGSPGAAGWDLYSDEVARTIRPGAREMFETGIAVSLPANTAGMIWPRSGLAYKHGIDVLAGLIDSDYRGPVNVILQNHGAEPVTIYFGQRIAQLVVQPIYANSLCVVSDLGQTLRGEGGFGSTGA